MFNFISKSIGSFMAQGSSAMSGMSNAIASQSKKIWGGVTSWSSVTPSTFFAKLSSMISSRVSDIRGSNPRAVTKNYSSTQRSSNSSDMYGQGFYEFADVCDGLSDSIPSIISAEATLSAEKMRTRLMQYPPAPSGSTYNRTFELQQGWRTATISFDIDTTFAIDSVPSITNADASVNLPNNVPYAKWVQRRATQSSIHRGRWNTVEDVAEQETPDFVNRIQDFLTQLLSRF
jgi:hypothetical protein